MSTEGIISKHLVKNTFRNNEQTIITSGNLIPLKLPHSVDNRGRLNTSKLKERLFTYNVALKAMKKFLENVHL